MSNEPYCMPFSAPSVRTKLAHTLHLSSTDRSHTAHASSINSHTSSHNTHCFDRHYSLLQYSTAQYAPCTAVTMHSNHHAQQIPNVTATPLPLFCSTTIASAAYERVLELDPTNADALLGLASIKFNSTNVQQVWMRASHHLVVDNVLSSPSSFLLCFVLGIVNSCKVWLF